MIEYGVEINYKIHKVSSIFWLIFMMAYTLSITFHSINDFTTLFFHDKSGFIILMPMFVMFHFVCIMSQFFFYIIGVKIRLSKLNTLISKYFCIDEKTLYPGANSDDSRMKIIQDITICHDKIVDATEIINFCYGFPVKYILNPPNKY